MQAWYKTTLSVFAHLRLEEKTERRTRRERGPAKWLLRPQSRASFLSASFLLLSRLNFQISEFCRSPEAFLLFACRLSVLLSFFCCCLLFVSVLVLWFHTISLVSNPLFLHPLYSYSLVRHVLLFLGPEKCRAGLRSRQIVRAYVTPPPLFFESWQQFFTKS